MIAVTGSAGFIGSVVMHALIERGGEDVLVVDTMGSGQKFKNLRAKPIKEIIAPENFLKALANGDYKPSAIIHMGAKTDSAELDVDLLVRMNTTFTRALARLSMAKGIRFIYASAASVYGDGAFGFSDSDELTPKLLPPNGFAFSKWLFDVEAIRAGWQQKIAGLRFFNVFGPNEYHKGRMASVVYRSYRQVLEHHRLQLFQSHKKGCDDGEQRRDFVYVFDVARVILWFLDHPEANGIFNLGTGEARTFNDLAKAIFSGLEMPQKIEYIPTPEDIRASYQYFTEADLTRLRAAGCDIAFTPLETAVDDYIRNYLTKDNPHV